MQMNWKRFFFTPDELIEEIEDYILIKASDDDL